MLIDYGLRDIVAERLDAGIRFGEKLEKDGRALEVKVGGPLTFNEPEPMLDAAIDGLGIANVFEEQAAAAIAAGRLVRLLEDWTPAFPGYFLYYPSRRQTPPALSALVARYAVTPAFAVA